VSDARHQLQRAATYRALSLLFVPPSAGLMEELQGLSREVIPEVADGLAELAHTVPPGLSGLYHSCLGPTGPCRDCETDFDLRGVAGKGTILSDIAAFYKAFRFEPLADPPLSPDHVSRQLGFLGYLALKTSLAMHQGEDEHVATCQDAETKFVREHLGRWVRRFCKRVQDTAGSDFYADAAALAERALMALEPDRLAPPTGTEFSLPVVEPDECAGPAGWG